MASAEAITFELEGRKVHARPGETLLDVADREGMAIPRLCHQAGMAPAGNCRACMVEVQGERVLAAACCRHVQPGMQVQAGSPRARQAQKMVLELLLADTAAAAGTDRGALDLWAARLGVGAPRLPARAPVPADASHPAITVDLNACIQCTRCLRACRDLQVNDVIGLAGRGAAAKIVFDLDDPLGASSCVACGECVQACPTGALRDAGAVATRADKAVATRAAEAAPAVRQVDSLCPYCGVGCQVRYHVQGEAIIAAEGRNGPANQGRLCVKGRYGFDYVAHPQRLTVPLVRREGAPKDPAQCQQPGRLMEWFREATWDEALALAGARLRRLRDTQGPQALAGFGSAKGSNEEAYLFQKLVRLGFGSHNVDHCTRLCHASSVAALLEGLGSGAVSNPVRDVLQAEVVVVIGANPGANHPVAASWIRNAVQQGTQLVLIDPRRTELARLATHHLAFTPGSDVALLNALLHVIVSEGLVDRAFVAARTHGFDELVRHLRPYTPEAMAPLCGIPAATLRAVARRYASSRASMIFWGMGISQHVHGTDNARCLIALALATGQVGRPGTGLHPLRGQNNVQGASDAGLIPMMYPDYQRVSDPAARDRFASAWGVPAERLSLQPGLTVVEVMHAIHAGTVHGMFIVGENPAMSDPDANQARAALAALDTLVVQDIFPTETALLADVILPASAFAEKTGSFTNTDRLVQLARPVRQPPGQARPDLRILLDLARELGLDESAHGDPSQDIAAVTASVFEEMRGLMPSIAGMSWARLQRSGAVTYPCRTAGDPGEAVVFQDHFPTADGRARFVPAHPMPPDERPDADYPFVLITGRQLEHWHTGSMTRRSAVLDALEPVAVAWLHPLDLAALGLRPGAALQLRSRRGEVTLAARADEGTPRGAVFVAFCWAEAAINRLTNPALDPVGHIPEFKFCAVRVQAAAALPSATDTPLAALQP
jgi:formate dehydrogenase major subunit